MNPILWVLLAICIAGIITLFTMRKSPKPKRYDRFKVPEKAPIQPGVPPDPIVDAAVEEIYPGFEGMDRYFQRLSESSFRSYCHSQASGGIGMKIRNKFAFWDILIESRKDPAYLYRTDSKVVLYNHLLNKYNCPHPDAMSDFLVIKVYQRYYREHPEAQAEYDRFQQFRGSSKYKPAFPFDVRYPWEKL